MIIKKGIEYERVKIANNKDNPIITIKVSTKKNETTIIAGHYRQWKHPSVQASSLSREEISNQKKRLEKLIKSL